MAQTGCIWIPKSSCVGKLCVTNLSCECRDGANQDKPCSNGETCSIMDCFRNCPPWNEWGSCRGGVQIRYRNCPCAGKANPFQLELNGTCIEQVSCDMDTSQILLIVSIVFCIALVIVCLAMSVVMYFKLRRERRNANWIPPRVTPELPQPMDSFGDKIRKDKGKDSRAREGKEEKEVNHDESERKTSKRRAQEKPTAPQFHPPPGTKPPPYMSPEIHEK